jgi:hypothetical protein
MIVAPARALAGALFPLDPSGKGASVTAREEIPMTDPVIVAAAALMLIPSLAPDVRVPPLHAFTVPEAAAAYSAFCERPFEDEPNAHHVRHLTPGPSSQNHLTVRLRPSPRPLPVYVRHHHHHR